MILNFTVPKEIYSQIDSYDVEKPKPVKPVKERPQNTFPKAGIPENLVPENILPKARLIELIQIMNRSNGSHHYSLTHQYVNHENNHVLLLKLANKYWFSIWFNTEDKETVFGYSICMRNLKSYKSYGRGYFWNTYNVSEEDFTEVKHSKKDYLYLHKSVTKEDLDTRKFNSRNVCCLDNSLSTLSTLFLDEFRKKMKNYINIWNNHQIFQAYNTSMAEIIGYSKEYNNFSWKPDFSYIISCSNYDQEFVKKLETPFFRKKINNICNTFIQEFNSPEFDRWNHSFKTAPLKTLEGIDRMYSYSIPIDHLQSLWDYFEQTQFKNSYYNQPTYYTGDWLKENIPVKSFVNMYIKDYRLMNDTVSMVRSLSEKKPDIKYEGRWRPQEFHDWAMAEHWKLSNKNEKLPQDLFPSPIKVDTMTFIQPINTHQLSHWGRAARNCVGSSTYSNGILKKNHFIILALKNNEPYLTIQAILKNSTLEVIQIKKTCNANLAHDEKVQYENAFKKALMIRSQELENAVH